MPRRARCALGPGGQLSAASPSLETEPRARNAGRGRGTPGRATARPRRPRVCSAWLMAAGSLSGRGSRRRRGQGLAPRAAGGGLRVRLIRWAGGEGGQGAPSRPDVLCPTRPAEPGLHLSLRLSSVQPDFIIHRPPSLYVRAFYFILFFYPGSGFHISKEILGIYVVTWGRRISSSADISRGAWFSEKRCEREGHGSQAARQKPQRLRRRLGAAGGRQGAPGPAPPVGSPLSARVRQLGAEAGGRQWRKGTAVRGRGRRIVHSASEVSALRLRGSQGCAAAPTRLLRPRSRPQEYRIP